MNIGAAARDTGLPVKTIRYYEEIGLVTADRADNGYRTFGPDALGRLRFIAQARLLGFSLEECRRLAVLNDDRTRASRDVRALAERNLASVRAKLRQLRDLEAKLETLITNCHGDDDPECAILDGMSHNAAG